MFITGYKAFNKDMTNRYGTKFKAGILYTSNGIVKFKSNGFHLCKNFEDTLRYFDAFNEQINICKVSGFGNLDKYNDEYYGYLDMYAVEKLYIDKLLNRNEILEIAKDLPNYRLERFVSLYKLTQEEIDFLKPFSDDVERAIQYYQ